MIFVTGSCYFILLFDAIIAYFGMALNGAYLYVQPHFNGKQHKKEMTEIIVCGWIGKSVLCV